MAKEFTKEDVIQNKKEAIRELNKMLEHLINDKSDRHLKKAHLISYWLKDYIQMIEFEEKFQPTRNIAYKRGNIVKLNFGFNIGAEYGGLHYGIVIDNKNDHNSPVLTIIPLTSIKDSSTVHKNSVELGNELYKSLKIKYDTISAALKAEQQEIRETTQAFSTLVNFTSKMFENAKMIENPHQRDTEFQKIESYLESAHKLDALWEEKKKHNEEQQLYLEKIGQEISRMKEGSIALVNQITTVSKIRIFDPRNLKGVLSGITLSEEGMEKINRKMKELYIF